MNGNRKEINDCSKNGTKPFEKQIKCALCLLPLRKKIWRDAESYFDEHLAQNDYYAAGEIRPGQWIGAGAERLGLKSERHPRTISCAV